MHSKPCRAPDVYVLILCALSLRWTIAERIWISTYCNDAEHNIQPAIIVPPRWPSGKAVASRAAYMGSIPAFAVDLFSRVSQTTGIKTGTLGSTLPGAWRYRVNDGTGWPGVCTLWLGKIESLICNVYLSVAVLTTASAHPSLLLLLRSPAISLGFIIFGWDFCVCDRFLIQPLR